jgi:hypothetical protein
MLRKITSRTDSDVRKLIIWTSASVRFHCNVSVDIYVTYRFTKAVFVRMGKKCSPASGSSTLPRRTVPKIGCSSSIHSAPGWAHYIAAYKHLFTQWPYSSYIIGLPSKFLFFRNIYATCFLHISEIITLIFHHSPSNSRYASRLEFPYSICISFTNISFQFWNVLSCRVSTLSFYDLHYVIRLASFFILILLPSFLLPSSFYY